MFVPGLMVMLPPVDCATNEILAVFVAPFRTAVTVAVELAVIVPAVALNVAEDAPDCTVTDTGAASAAESSETATVIADVAVPLSATVHVEIPPEFRLEGAHASDESVGGGGGGVVLGGGSDV